MYIMYVDESGDVGLVGSPSSYFALTGITVHESRWRDFLERLVQFRRTMRAVYGLPLRTEIHAAEFIRRAPLPNIRKHQRLAILRNFLDELAAFPDIRVTSVVVNKATKPASYDVFEQAWRALIQRFENTIGYGNFPGAYRNDKGLVIVDNTDGRKLQRLLRRMAVHNPIPNMAHIGSGYRNLPLVRLVEDANHRDSTESYLIQACDVCAYFLRQKFEPCGYVRKQSAKNYYDRLDAVLNKSASKSNGFGIVTI